MVGPDAVLHRIPYKDYLADAMVECQRDHRSEVVAGELVDIEHMEVADNV